MRRHVRFLILGRFDGLTVVRCRGDINDARVRLVDLRRLDKDILSDFLGDLNSALSRFDN